MTEKEKLLDLKKQYEKTLEFIKSNCYDENVEMYNAIILTIKNIDKKIKEND